MHVAFRGDQGYVIASWDDHLGDPDVSLVNLELLAIERLFRDREDIEAKRGLSDSQLFLLANMPRSGRPVEHLAGSSGARYIRRRSMDVFDLTFIASLY